MRNNVVSFLQVFAILSHLPRGRNGKMKIDEFINLPIISEETFNAIDRNKDGFLTKGEIKLTNKNATMSEVLEVCNSSRRNWLNKTSFQVIKEHDQDKDGKLNMEEYRDFLEEEEEEERGSQY